MELSPARLLQLYLTESDRSGDKPLYEAVVDKCRELRIAGATVSRGLEGYGSEADIRRPGFLSHAMPVVVTVVDTAENLARLLPALEAMMDTGMIATEEVQVRRVEKSRIA